MNSETTTRRKAAKRGTIGFMINQLVKRFGSYPTGIYILEQALLHATGMEGVYFRKDRDTQVLMHDTPGYKAAQASEEACLARLRAEGVIK